MLPLPARYERIAPLGQGGGGEVWAVRDRLDGRSLALKALAAEASEGAMAALVREAVALSGLEGLGVPRVVAFGRLAESGRPYLVRELVEGRSLEAALAAGEGAERVLGAVARAAEQLTALHRSGLLHGDLKPANIIVGAGGHATLVDLGLAAPWQDSGATPEGLTPRYAAPELLAGGPLTVRGEIYALGVTLGEVLAALALPAAERAALRAVVRRATEADPARRYPSADEFAAALLAATPRLAAPTAEPALLWPVVGIDATAAALLAAATALGPGRRLLIEGPPGSGRTVLLRRLAWSLGAQGVPVVHLPGELLADAARLDQALSWEASDRAWVLIDDLASAGPAVAAALERAAAHGARLVAVVGEASRPAGGALEGASVFRVPPLEAPVAAELVRRAVPALTARLVAQVVEHAAGRPGPLRAAVERLAREPVASRADVERALSVAPPEPTSSKASSAPPGRGGPEHPGSGPDLDDALARARRALDRGRFNEAHAALRELGPAPDQQDALAVGAAWARWELGVGEVGAARARLQALRALPGGAAQREVALLGARAELASGDYRGALGLAAPLAGDDALGVEARVCAALARSFLAEHAAACAALAEAAGRARALGDERVESIALSALGFAHQRADHVSEARRHYEEAIRVAERVGDASTLATTQLNLAGLCKVAGEIAPALSAYEAAVDMAQRAGRLATVRQALLNLANLDLYLGRLGRAESAIGELLAGRDQLSGAGRAQLEGLAAELEARRGDPERAAQAFERCARAYLDAGHPHDAAEALLEGALVALRGPTRAPVAAWLAEAEGLLGEASVHRPLRELAAARWAERSGDEAGARRRLERALSEAREARQREWEWRTLVARAELSSAAGQPTLAQRDREEALVVLETIGASLPRDLREVYWDDPRRRAVREQVRSNLAAARTEHGVFTGTLPPPGPSAHALPPEATLARILSINADLAGLFDTERLAARVVEHAVDLFRAERGFAVLRDREGGLVVFGSRARAGDDPGAAFSRSIAERVIGTGEPVVTSSAREDPLLGSFASVHHLSLQSVACVPIRSPAGPAIGALWVETRAHRAAHFQREIATLSALADQVAIALENARLVEENRRRSEELAAANRELTEAQARLRELLGHRTRKLSDARRQLQEARHTLEGHFGFHGLVGTSEAMRRVYALVERLKDTEVPVLITGESGTGKEVVARALHQVSERRKRAFQAVNCAAIPEHLLESELFGSVRGAYTGADRDRRGLIREAEGGTLFLDEIGEMPHKMQAGLLRVLQERRVRAVGGEREEPVDVRLVFATHRDLQALVAAGRFREDLYYRIQVVEVRLPPLRERLEDLPPLVDHFLGLFAARYQRDKRTLSRAALRALGAHTWPGNVRELEHVLLNAWVMSERAEIDVTDLDLPVMRRRPAEGAGAVGAPLGAAGAGARAARRETESQHDRDERDRILAALRASGWNRLKAAELVGIPRRTFYRRLKAFGIQ